MSQVILKEIQEAEMVLIGLGEEFNEIKKLKEQEGYVTQKELLQVSTQEWLLPALNEIYHEKLYNGKKDRVIQALQKLAEQLQGKNYFVVSLADYKEITNLWDANRFVAPCGGISKKQCEAGCAVALQAITQTDINTINGYLEQLRTIDENNADTVDFERMPQLGICPACGKRMILNNIHAEKYDENGYLTQWQLYTKWLQGTLNRKVLILELGVGMEFPSVIRWPFEKMAYFNQKSKFYRVNGTLYQLTEKLGGNATAIPKNSIDWLESLC